MADYHPVIGEAEVTLTARVRIGPQQLPSGQWVVWLEGKSGCVAVEACTPAKEVA